MTVRYYGDVKKFTKKDKEEIDNVNSLSELIKGLTVLYGSPFGDYLVADGTCFYLVDGLSIIHTGGLETPLKPDSIVQIIPHVEAG